MDLDTFPLLFEKENILLRSAEFEIFYKYLDEILKFMYTNRVTFRNRIDQLTRHLTRNGRKEFPEHLFSFRKDKMIRIRTTQVNSKSKQSCVTCVMFL